MTPEEKRIAIAEACGWKNLRTEEFLCRLILVGDTAEGARAVPDYLNDLNAMQCAIKVHNDGWWEDYLKNLITICGHDPDRGWDFRPVVEATADQRADALLLTLGLMKP